MGLVTLLRTSASLCVSNGSDVNSLGSVKIRWKLFSLKCANNKHKYYIVIEILNVLPIKDWHLSVADRLGIVEYELAL